MNTPAARSAFTRATAAVAFCAAMTFAASTPYAAERIGVASTVKNTVTGTVGGALRPGSGIYHREVITSEGDGEAQLLFLDETIFNVGAGAKVTLDEFIYDPNRKTGNIVVNVTKGAFRFITGSAKPESYTIKTPVATIGVRGTIFQVDKLTDVFMELRLLQGKLFICLKPGAQIEGTGIDQQEPVRRDGEDCYLVTPGLFNIGFGPLDNWQNPNGNTSDPNDGNDDPVDDNPPGPVDIEEFNFDYRALECQKC